MSAELSPADEHNGRLLSHVHPPDWLNPQPSNPYNLVVVGAGTAGLVAAAGCAGLGGRVALIERHLLGGDCLNYGCVPSKALLSAAHRSAAVRDAGGFGVRVPPGVEVDFSAVMQRMRKLRADIAPHDSAARFSGLGVDVFLGQGRFTGKNRVEVDGRELRFKRAVIATGARPAAVELPGLAEAGYLTNETIFSLTELPPRLAVIGAGPIGCELAQAFARFGSQVHLIEQGERVLPRDDAEAAQYVEPALARDGVQLHLQARVERIASEGQEKVLHLQATEQETAVPETLHVDAILLGIGRAPNVQGLGLEAAEVKFDERQGVEVNDFLQTSNPNIYAAGDVCSKLKFTHTADAQARLVLQNALFFGRAKASSLTIPWCTYTSPEVAHVGLTEAQARERGEKFDTLIEHLEHVDRAIVEGDTGLVKVLLRRGSDTILGATIVAPHAGEMISEITLAMVGKLGLKRIASTIHPYPTQAEAIKRVADAYNRTRLTPRVKRIFERWLAWRR